MIKDTETLLINSLYELLEKESEFKDHRASIVNVKDDEFPFERTLEAFDFTFQLITKRYEKKSIVLTTNEPFGKWAKFLMIVIT